MKESMRCFICDQENHFSFGKLNPERELLICKNCGNIAYHVTKEDEEKIKHYYDKEYRGQIGVQNLTTTTRKLNFVKMFLLPWFSDKEKFDEKTGGLISHPLVIGDVGCATGYLVDWFRRRGHKATGSEWTTTMRRFAEHFYGIPVTQELTPKHKYDLLTMYHTLEHMVEPDKKLEKYKSLLADDGTMMISVPEWLDVLYEPGMGHVSSFLNVFHKDHIDVFTRRSFENLLGKVGLTIEHEERDVYGQDYLVKKGKVSPILKENWEEQRDKIMKIKNAIELYKQEKYRDAVTLWPKFPAAYMDWIFNSSVRKDPGKQKDLFVEAMKIMPDNIMLINGLAQWHYQRAEYEKALEFYTWIEKRKVNEDVLMFKGYCLFHLGKFTESMVAFHDSCSMSPVKWQEAMTWVCKASTEMPCWEEKAEKQLKDKLFEKAKPQIEPLDPLFEEFETNGGPSGEPKKEPKKPVDKVPAKT